LLWPREGDLEVGEICKVYVAVGRGVKGCAAGRQKGRGRAGETAEALGEIEERNFPELAASRAVTDVEAQACAGAQIAAGVAGGAEAPRVGCDERVAELAVVGGIVVAIQCTNTADQARPRLQRILTDAKQGGANVLGTRDAVIAVGAGGASNRDARRQQIKRFHGFPELVADQGLGRVRINAKIV